MTIARNELGLQESALSSTGNVLQRVRELVIQANNATQSDQSRAAIADELNNLSDELLQLSNTKNSSSEYIFSGFDSRTPTYTRTGTGFSYQGDQGQRFIQVSEDAQLAVRDTGVDVFEGMKNGDGRFDLVTPGTNTGSGLVLMTTKSDATVDDYSITFTQASDTDPIIYSVTGTQSGGRCNGDL